MIDIEHEQGTLHLSGTLSQATVMGALNTALSLLPSEQAMNIDLSNITHCDSASLAFLLALLRQANLNRTPLVFEGIPTEMHQLARVSGILPFLPIRDA